MPEDWNAVAADVAAGLLEAGTTAAIIRDGVPTGPAYDPTPGVDITAPCTVAFDSFRASEIDGTMIQRGDVKVLMAVTGFAIAADKDGNNANTPTPADRLLASGKQYAIIDVKPLRPGGVAVMWEIQARA